MSQAGASAAIDETTAWALVALPHADDAGVLRWFGALQQAHEACQAGGDPGWEALREHIIAVAAPEYGDVAAVEGFVAALDGTGQGAEIIEQLLHLHGQLPDLYWQVAGGGGAEAAQEAGDGGSFTWLTAEQHQHVSSWWENGWPSILTAHLNSRWGEGWEQHPAEHKVAWLDDLIREWSGAADFTPSPEELNEVVDAALKELLAEEPDAAELSKEDIEELRAELLEELAGGTSPS